MTLHLIFKIRAALKYTAQKQDMSPVWPKCKDIFIIAFIVHFHLFSLGPKICREYLFLKWHVNVKQNFKKKKNSFKEEVAYIDTIQALPSVKFIHHSLSKGELPRPCKG